MNITDIQQRIQYAKQIDFGTIFNQSIELFKKVWVQGLVTVLLNGVLAIPLIMIVYIPLIFLGFFDMYTTDYNYYDSGYQQDFSPLLGLVSLLLYVFAIAAISIVAFGLQAGFYRICKLRDLELLGKDDYFFFFKKQYLGKTVKLGLVCAGIAMLAAMLCFFPVFYVMIPLTYVYLFYAFNPDKPISEIINLSFSLGNKKWFITFGLIFVAGFLSGIVGLMMCGVGIYVTQSFGRLPSYFIYKDVVGFDEEDDIVKIGEEVKF